MPFPSPFPFPWEEDGEERVYRRMIAPPFLVERSIAICSESSCYDSPGDGGGASSGTVVTVDDGFGVHEDDDDDVDDVGDGAPAKITDTVDNPSLHPDDLSR